MEERTLKDQDLKPIEDLFRQHLSEQYTQGLKNGMWTVASGILEIISSKQNVMNRIRSFCQIILSNKPNEQK